MSARSLSIVLILNFAAIAPTVSWARLGETEAQSQSRYGTPSPELIGADERPLLDGAKELAYNFQGWRIRVAFLDGAAARLEYAHIPGAGGLKKISADEAEAILEAEEGSYRWREIKPRTGHAGLDALKTVFEGRSWERSDHATATLKMDLVLVLDARSVEAYQKKRARAGSKATPPPQVPKF